MTAAGVIDELHRRHAFGMLVKEGARGRTSRYPSVLRAQPSINSVQTHMIRERPYRILVESTNAGDTVWLSGRNKLGGHVTVGCKLQRPDGFLISDTLGRTPIPADLAPGGKATVAVDIALPLTLRPGPTR